jgi:prepilin signal peptidase PulO-like enzyme (type II secretory pathway)
MEQIYSLTIFVFGASIGSFLNVLIDRLPREESINGRSHCDFCGKKIAWFDLLPVLSFYILKGRTRCCHKKLSFQYPLIEITTGIIFILIFNLNFKFQISNLFVLWGIVSCLLVIFVSDLKYQLISDYILLALFIFSILLKFVTPLSGVQIIGMNILSGLIVAFPIGLIYFISRERAMGLGDVYLSVIIGFLLGWKEGFLALYIGFVTGAIFGFILMIIKNKKLKSKIAFGPFLVIGTVVMLFWEEKVMEILKRIYGY